MKSRGRTVPILTLTILLSFALYSKSLYYYFFQDDWFVLNWVRTQELWSFFNFRTDIIYWRPLSMPLFFVSLYKLFHLNHIAYHTVAFGLFFMLNIVVYKLSQKLTKNNLSSLICTFLYAISSIHFISLSWLATTSYIVGPLLAFSSLFFFISFCQKKSLVYYLTTIILYLLALTATEFSLVLPLIMLAWTVLYSKSKYLMYLAPILVINLIYLYTRFILFPLPARDDYGISFNFQVVNNFVWYVLWAFNVPESFKSLIFLSLPEQSFKVITQFWQITLSVSALIIITSISLVSNLRRFKRDILFGAVFFMVGILPVIFIIKHSYPVYLSLAILGIISPLSKILSSSSKKIVFVFLSLWLVSSFYSLQFTYPTHWVNNVQKISNIYAHAMKEKAPNPPNDSIFVIKPASVSYATANHFVIIDGEDTLKLSLNNQDAAKVIYDNSNLRSVYLTHQDKITLQENLIEIYPN